jgi:capsular polysaccharide biosynthesis protein
MYLNPEFFIEKHSKRMVFTVLGNFIQVRTTLPRNKTPKVISKKYLDYSILLSKLESLLSPPKKLSNIVYVVRKGVRYVLNDKEIIEALKIKYKGKYNVIVVDFSEKSFQEQIDIMNGCILFIGCHGAGFTNVYFMAQNTNMLEFFPESFYAYCYVYICIRKHIKHYFLHGKSTVTPPITLDTYLKKRYLPEYNTVDFRRSIKNMTFSMNCAQVIKKVSEILD